MKVLVTGVEGFVGPYLVEQLIQDGYSVTGTYHKTKPLLNINLYQLDILSKKDVNEVFNEVSPDIIFHLAGISNVRWSFDNPEITRNINVDGTKNILEAFENYSSKGKLLLISSSEVYGYPDFLPITEDHSLNPVNPYGKSKKEVENLANKSIKKGFTVIIPRSFTHIGPQQSEHFVCSSFAQQIAKIEKGKQATIKVGNLDAKRDFTDVRDIAKAYALLARTNESGIYNVCSGKSYEINSILQTLISFSSKKIIIETDPKRMRPSDVLEFKGSYKKLNEKTGWHPEINIQDTLEEILNYWRGEIK